MNSIREIITNVVFNNLNQLISKLIIYDLLDEIIIDNDTEPNPLFRLIGHSTDSIYYVCLTYNITITIDSLINYLNHSESEDKMLAQDIISSIKDRSNIIYECFINTSIEDEYSPLISASNSSELITLQRSLPNLSLSPLIIDSQTSITRNDENDSCLLCYNPSSYCCSTCKYPLCSNCVEIISSSSCKCPCCQTEPLKIICIS